MFACHVSDILLVHDCIDVLFFVVFYNLFILSFFFLMIRRPPRSTLDRSSAASDVYKRQVCDERGDRAGVEDLVEPEPPR